MLIGIDLGGTKIEIVVLDGEREVLRRRIASPSHDYRALVDAVGDLVDDAERTVGTRCSVGIGGPGAVSRATGLMKNANSTVLNGRPLQADLARRLGRPVRLANDANCLALSEATDGAAARSGVVFAVILGTGIGGGIVANGRLLEGCNAIAGEWGHNPLPWPNPDELPGPHCYCGRRGCLEMWLSGPGMARDDAAHAQRRLTAVEIAAAAEAGDGTARRTLDRYFDRLGRGLASVIDVLDPEVVVFGGGLSNLAALLAEAPLRVAAYAFTDVLETRFVRAAHGDSSGVRGAAWLWRTEAHG